MSAYSRDMVGTSVTAHKKHEIKDEHRMIAQSFHVPSLGTQRG